MKHVKLFENWTEDEDNDQTAYVDTPVAQASMDMGDEEMADSGEEIYADGIGYDDTEVEEEEEMENEEE